MADASHIIYEQQLTEGSQFGYHLDCSFDGKGGAACAEEFWHGGGSTVTTTFPASVTPVYTLTADGSQAGGLGNNGNGASSLAPSVKLGVVAAGMVAGVFLVL